MYNLIRKDFIAMRWYLLFVLGYAVFFGTFSGFPVFSPIMIITLPAVMMTLFAANIELRNKTMMFVGTLPVRRKQIVLAKYISIFLYLAVGLILLVIVHLVNEYIIHQSFPITVLSLIVSAGIAMTYSALYFPIQFLLGVKSSNIVSFISIFLMIFLISLIGNVADKATEFNWPILPIMIGLPVAAIILMYLSYRLSLSIFRRKDMEG
ncbi:ABC-2 transporter permease [Paenibacillus paeoniae]|uniref:ABC-2 transporter permease n=1 Tax=Paenibacillus paeoniae TaxID=2292705 RepID=A0A371PLF1_9BACL|nr:ABC-2 transporter permease [Paenibacillus paeoniae]REK76587.1 ABC-2 transporter permease [Paenibacillus paeoniae]